MTQGRYGLPDLGRVTDEISPINHVSADDHHKHTAYLIEHSGLRQFTPDEVAVLACLGRFHRRGDLKPGYAPFRGLDASPRLIPTARNCDSLGIPKSVKL